MSYEIVRRLEWDMAHRVPLHESKCKSLHGHRYAAEIHCAADELTEEGFVIDFGLVKKLVGGWIDEHWDHTTMFQSGDNIMVRMRNAQHEEGLRPWFRLEHPPTAEHIARHLFEVAVGLLKEKHIYVTRVVLWETPNCRAVWPA